jgi:hypothetical protein
MFGKTRENAEERALEKWKMKNPTLEPLHIWAFGMKKPVPRKEWYPQWKCMYERKKQLST